MMKTIKPGDRVFHRPTGETWVVAYVDPDRDELAWCGWPAGTAKLSDCEFRESATEEESADLIRRFAKGIYTDRGYLDHRSAAVRRLYPAALQ